MRTKKITFPNGVLTKQSLLNYIMSLPEDALVYSVTHLAVDSKEFPKTYPFGESLKEVELPRNINNSESNS